MKLLKSLGTFGPYEVNKVIWEDGDKGDEGTYGLGVLIFNKPVLDIRRFEYKKGIKIPRNGICMTNQMVASCAINMIAERKTPKDIQYCGRHREKDFFIHEIIGTLRCTPEYSIILSRTAFLDKDNVKYDIRPWNKDYTKFDFGIMLPDEEFTLFQDMILEYIEEEGIEPPFYEQNIQKLARGDIDALLRSLLIAMDKAYIAVDNVKFEEFKQKLNNIKIFV